MSFEIPSTQPPSAQGGSVLGALTGGGAPGGKRRSRRQEQGAPGGPGEPTKKADETDESAQQGEASSAPAERSRRPRPPQESQEPQKTAQRTPESRTRGTTPAAPPPEDGWTPPRRPLPSAPTNRIPPHLYRSARASGGAYVAAERAAERRWIEWADDVERMRDAGVGEDQIAQVAATIGAPVPDPRPGR